MWIMSICFPAIGGILSYYAMNIPSQITRATAVLTVLRRANGAKVSLHYRLLAESLPYQAGFAFVLTQIRLGLLLSAVSAPYNVLLCWRNDEFPGVIPQDGLLSPLTSSFSIRDRPGSLIPWSMGLGSRALNWTLFASTADFLGLSFPGTLP